MTRTQRIVVLVAVAFGTFALLSLGGCGGGSDVQEVNPTQQPEATMPRPVMVVEVPQ